MHALCNAGLLKQTFHVRCTVLLRASTDGLAISSGRDAALVRQNVLPFANAERLVKPAVPFKSIGAVRKSRRVKPAARQRFADHMRKDSNDGYGDNKAQRLCDNGHRLFSDPFSAV